MGISRSAALTALVALSFGWLACSGEDDGTGKGTGAATAAGSAGAAGSGTLAVGGRAGGENGGSAGAAGEGLGGGGSAGAAPAPYCLPPIAPSASVSCDGTAPQNVALLAVAPLPIVVPLPTALTLASRPNVFAVRGRGTQVPLVVGRADGGIVTWRVADPSGAFDQVSGATLLGDDLWITSSYTPHRLWRCIIGTDLATTCEQKSDFPHDNANGSIFAVPAGSCDHPEGALLVVDTPEGVAPLTELHDAHLFDIASGVWSTVKRPTGERRDLSLVLRLRDGRALFVGGDGAVDPVANTEIFDGKTLTAGPTLAHRRLGQGMTLFPDGRVLVTGGYAEEQKLPSWEIVDVVAGTSTASTQPAADKLGRAFAAATGRFGNCGYVSLGGRNADASAAIDYFAFAKPGFERLAAPVLPAPVEYAATVTLPDGSLLYVGGRTPATDSGSAGEFHGDAFRVFSQ